VPLLSAEHPIFRCGSENQVNALQPPHLEAAMRKIWCRGGGSKGLSMAKKETDIVLNPFTGICYV